MRFGDLPFRKAFVALMALIWSQTGGAAAASSFTFPGTSTPLTVSMFGFSGGVDISGLILSDLAEGLRVSGIVTITVEDIGGTSGAGFQLTSEREFTSPSASLRAVPHVHMSGSYSVSENIGLLGIGATTGIGGTGGTCAAAVSVDDSGSALASSGSFNESFTGNNVNPAHPCLALGSVSDANRVGHTFGVTFAYSGSGTLTFNFGNSLMSEATVDPASVPEPASLLLMGCGGLAIFMRARRMRPSSDEAELRKTR